MNKINVHSSMLATVGYDSQDKYLEVEFVKGGTYAYYNVPENVFQSLLKAKSLGQFMWANIIDHYAYKKIEKKKKSTKK
ncbi:MAG: KTSC domain-containing protein [Raineya sp.]|nr:KTSC domain-containing protein [Raineya sp.]